MEVFAVPKDQRGRNVRKEGCAGFDRLPFHDTQEPRMWVKYSEDARQATTRSRCNRMEMENAQAVTECAGKEALSGPREAFTGTAG
jgi:hypothetical protein